MHGADDSQLCQSGVGKLLICKSLWNHADDAATVIQTRICDSAHKANAATAIHKLYAALAKDPANSQRRLPIRLRCPSARAAKYADSAKHLRSVSQPQGEAAETRQTLLPVSSAINSPPLLSTARPTGRPRALSPSTRKPVTTSSGGPEGRPSTNGM